MEPSTSTNYYSPHQDTIPTQHEESYFNTVDVPHPRPYSSLVSDSYDNIPNKRRKGSDPSEPLPIVPPLGDDNNPTETQDSADYSHFAPPNAFQSTSRSHSPQGSTNNYVIVDEGKSSIMANKNRSPGAYSRKDKALGLLAQRLVDMYEGQNDNNNGNMEPLPKPDCSGRMHNLDKVSISLLSIDQTASCLSVERRRIYDIVNILEALNVVQKKCKNVYWWHGLNVLEKTFKEIQIHAIACEEFHRDAEKNDMIPPESNDSYRLLRETKSTLFDNSKKSKKSKSKLPSNDSSFGSLGQLTKKFISLYLIGYDALSLGEATERLLGFVDDTDASDGEKGYGVSNTATHRTRDKQITGWKTKVRRLYDIANVLCSIGIIDKTAQPMNITRCGNMLTNDGKAVNFHKNNQYFYWTFHKTPKYLLESSSNSQPEEVNKETKIDSVYSADILLQQSTEKEVPIEQGEQDETNTQTVYEL